MKITLKMKKFILLGDTVVNERSGPQTRKCISFLSKYNSSPGDKLPMSANNTIQNLPLAVTGPFSASTFDAVLILE